MPLNIDSIRYVQRIAKLQQVPIIFDAPACLPQCLRSMQISVEEGTPQQYNICI